MIRSRKFEKPLRLASVLTISFAFAACGASRDEGKSGTDPTIDDPRAPSLSGTGTLDVIIADAPSGDAVAVSYGVSWWEIEMQLAGDVIDATAPVVSASDSTRVSIAFWGHDALGRATVEGRFNVDLTRWLALTEEHDAADIAGIFDGSDARFSNGGPLDDDERTAVFQSVLAAAQATSSSPSTGGKSLRPAPSIKGGPAAALGTCAGDGKKLLKDALSSIAKKFSTCASCASEAIDGPTSSAAWKACGACESGIKDGSGITPLVDFLKCKKALIMPPADDDTVVTRPPELKPETCWSSSSDKVHGTYRLTDGKGGITCGDCPSGTVPFESVLGCGPKGDDPYSPVDESKAIVEIPGPRGSVPTTRVISKDACILTEVTSQGTVNMLAVEAGPRRAGYRIGDRPWAELPSNKTKSSDTWNITSDTHSGSTKGSFAITGEEKSARPTVAPTKGTVDEATARGCSTDAVLGLSQQILEEVSRCLKPGMLVKVPGSGVLDTSRVQNTYLEKPAAEALVKAVASRKGARLYVNQMFRTVAQQYFISKVGPRKECGIKAWARPGFSNHETGIAIDIQDNASWHDALEAQGFKWLGSGDPVHFDYKGAGTVDIKGQDVLAFQRLWNRNHPEDKIAEDGSIGGETTKRLGIAPATGFPKGVPDTCGKTELAPSGKGSREPLEYLDNVTTSEHFPGEGCESGNDASHTDVSACLQSKAVCTPYWCDLADMRVPGCGTSVKEPVPAPATPAPSSAPKCDALGTFRLTYYYIAVESDFTGEKTVPIYGRDGKVLTTVTPKFAKAMRMEGTGKLTDGRALNWAGKCSYSEYDCFVPLDSKYADGRGASGRALKPYHSIAVDPSVIPLGTRVYVPELAGKTMPDGSVHDGWMVADDTGGAILGNHIDFFVQDRSAYRTLDTALKITKVTLVPEKC